MAQLKQRIRIETDGPLGKTARVSLIDVVDGEEVERPLRYVTGATVRLDVDGLVRASLEVLMVEGRFDAELEQLAVRYIGPGRWRLRKLWRAVRSWL